MNKIPKCSRKMVPLSKETKKINKGLNINKIKILTNKPKTRSFGKDITNITKNKDIKLPKKSSSCNEKVNNNI